MFVYSFENTGHEGIIKLLRMKRNRLNPPDKLKSLKRLSMVLILLLNLDEKEHLIHWIAQNVVSVHWMMMKESKMFSVNDRATNQTFSEYATDLVEMCCGSNHTVNRGFPCINYAQTYVMFKLWDSLCLSLFLRAHSQLLCGQVFSRTLFQKSGTVEKRKG